MMYFVLRGCESGGVLVEHKIIYSLLLNGRIGSERLVSITCEFFESLLHVNIFM